MYILVDRMGLKLHASTGRQLEHHWLESSDSAVLNCIALASGLIGVSRMTVRENHLLFDWRREGGKEGRG